MIFDNLEVLKQYSDISNGTAFSRIKSIMETVENAFIVPIIGEALYTHLDNAVTANAGNALTQIEKELLHHVRFVAGPLICYNYAPLSEVVMGDSGMQRLETANNKTAFNYQAKNYRKQNLMLAEMATEKLYSFLENNIADFPQWQSSPQYQQYKNIFIKTANEFSVLFSSQNPYRNYYAMRSKMVDVEQLYLNDIPSKIYSYLKNKDLTNTSFTEDESRALFALKKAIAHLTVALSIPTLNVRIDDEGISVVMGSLQSTDSRNPATDNALSVLIKSCTDTAKSWLAQFKNLTKYWTFNEDGSLQINTPSPTNPLTENDSNTLYVDAHYQGSTLAENYNPRNEKETINNKKSFIL